MTKKITVKFADSIEPLITKAKKVANANDAEFLGNTVSGSFSGKGVAGIYNVDRNQIIVKITDKPFWASWCLVESSINHFFMSYNGFTH